MASSDRMEIMKRVKDSISTHDCPKCDGPAYCAMMDGKSASACWCMASPYKSITANEDELCFCKNCL